MSSATVTPPPQPQTPTRAARLTAEEFGLKHSGDRVEYIDGEVKEIPMPTGTHGKVCGWVTFHLMQHIVTNDLGHVFTNDTFVKAPTQDDPERIYGPDVCYVSYTRLAKDAAVPNVIPIPPDLIVEVRSPSDTWALVFGKVGDYLGVGVPVVLVLDPGTRTASVYRSDEANPQQIFGYSDTLTITDALPGFSVLVATLFA